MILSELVVDSYRCYRGKTTSVPVAGSTKYLDIVGIINRKIQEWARDPNIDHPSRYEQRQLGTVVTGTQTYDLDDDILRLSDYVILTHPTSGAKTYITVVKPPQISRFTAGCYISNNNPKQITFITAINASNTGYKLIVPCYTIPDPLKNPNDTVVINNPYWLVYAVAAELARNDYAKDGQFNNLIGMANDLYQQMVDDARISSYLQPNGVTNAMPQSNVIGYNY